MDTESDNPYAPTPAAEPPAEQPSLVGPPDGDAHDANAAPQVGLTPLSPEEQALIEQQLRTKDTPGIYSNEELLKEAKEGKSEERKPVKSRDGKWHKPGEPEYDAIRKEIDASKTAVGDHQPDTPEAAADTNISTGDRAAQQKEIEQRQQVKEAIQQIAVADEGSKEQPHKLIDEVALKQVREENSTMKLKDTLGKLAALDNVAIAGVVEDIDPNKLMADPVARGPGANMAHAVAVAKKPEHEDIDPSALAAPPIVRGPGADRAYAAAMAAKQKKNDEFVALQKAREKSLGGDSKKS